MTTGSRFHYDVLNWSDHSFVQSVNSRIIPVRPNERAEQWLVTAILDGDLPPGSTLPAERTLATQLGVTRPTLREAIQRLARDGWLTIAHGKPTVVNDYWVEGGLNVLGKLVEHQTHLSPDFIEQLLEVRRNLAPAYTGLAVRRAADVVVALLGAAPAGDDDIALSAPGTQADTMLMCGSRIDIDAPEDAEVDAATVEAADATSRFPVAEATTDIAPKPASERAAPKTSLVERLNALGVPAE